MSVNKGYEDISRKLTPYKRGAIGDLEVERDANRGCQERAVRGLMMWLSR